MSRKTLGLIVFLLGMVALVVLHGKVWDEQSRIADHKIALEKSLETERQIKARLGPNGPRALHPSPPDFAFNAGANYWIYMLPALGLSVIGLVVFLISGKQASSPPAKRGKSAAVDALDVVDAAVDGADGDD